MIKRIAIAVVGSAIFAAPALAGTTYVVLPTPGSMAPATVYVDENGSRGDRVFVCDNINQIVVGTCRQHGRTRR